MTRPPIETPSSGPVLRRQELGDWQEEFVICRSGMQQDYWWPGARDVIKDFGIIADDFFHVPIIESRSWRDGEIWCREGRLKY